MFCAGVDVHEFQGLGPAQGAVLMARFLALVQTLERLPVPTIAVVHALNLTIGFELCLGCDLMWAAEDASFGLVEATVGLTPGGGGTQRLVARAGVARAAELVMTGDVYPAAEMHQWGVVNRLLPAAGLLEQARAFAARLAAGPTAATAVGKRLLQVARDHGVAAADAVTAREVRPDLRHPRPARRPAIPARAGAEPGHLRGRLARVPAGNSGKLGELDDRLGEDVLRCSRIAIRPGRSCARPRRPS